MDINVDPDESAGGSILSVRIIIEPGEKTSETASPLPTISNPNIPKGAIVSMDIDQIGGTEPGKGLKITFEGDKAA